MEDAAMLSAARRMLTLWSCPMATMNAMRAVILRGSIKDIARPRGTNIAERDLLHQHALPVPFVHLCCTTQSKTSMRTKLSTTIR